MEGSSTPTNPVGVRIHIAADGTILIGKADRSHAYSIACSPNDLRSLALELWSVAEALQPLMPAAVLSRDRDEDAKQWN